MWATWVRRRVWDALGVSCWIVADIVGSKFGWVLGVLTLLGLLTAWAVARIAAPSVRVLWRYYRYGDMEEVR